MKDRRHTARFLEGDNGLSTEKRPRLGPMCACFLSLNPFLPGVEVKFTNKKIDDLRSLDIFEQGHAQFPLS